MCSNLSNEPAAGPVGPSRGGSKILISVVDDDEAIRDSARQLLRSAGYHVATFDSAQSFLDSRSIEKSRCVILDVKMPGIDGLELQRRLNDSGAGVPIVFVTAHDEASIRRQAIAAGATNFLGKPFESRILLATVDAALTSAATKSAVYIVHFGQDDCRRLMILRNAGYTVQQYSSEAELVRSSESGALVDLICVSEGPLPPPSETLITVKTNCLAPVILFRTTTLAHSDFKFDLEIDPQTPPNQWLSDVETLLAASKDPREKSRELIRQSPFKSGQGSGKVSKDGSDGSQ
jgi:CheY-like chemotaxis protein